jgi:hypothetical protein
MSEEPTQKGISNPEISIDDGYLRALEAEIKNHQRDRWTQPWEEALDPYHHMPESSRWRDHRFPEENPSGNIGYKCHFRVEPSKVEEVSEFLKEKGFYHKYLSGGEVEAGKCFTVYIGSKDLTRQAVEFIEAQIGHLLQPNYGYPGYDQWSEHVSGRFSGNRFKYSTKTGRFGFNLTNKLDRHLFNKNLTREEVEAYRLSHQALIRDYGDYFGGGLGFYDTETGQWSVSPYPWQENRPDVKEGALSAYFNQKGSSNDGPTKESGGFRERTSLLEEYFNPGGKSTS